MVTIVTRVDAQIFCVCGASLRAKWDAEINALTILQLCGVCRQEYWAQGYEAGRKEREGK